jgi:hypothetical protein
MKEIFNIRQVADQLGRSYGQVWYAVIRGVVSPWQSGRSRLFTQRHVEDLRKHFDDRGQL